jgi:biopolymer transport protein ExbD
MNGLKKFAASENTMEQDAPVNIASIIDCFTVLITYILAAASFMSLGALEVGVATNSGADSALVSTAPIVSLHLHLTQDNQLQVKSVVGEQTDSSTVSFENLLAKVTDFKTQHPTMKAITISAEDSIPYANLVKVVANVRSLNVPVVFAGKSNVN